MSSSDWSKNASKRGSGCRKTKASANGSGAVTLLPDKSSGTAQPTHGLANAAVQVLMAQALGVAKTRLMLIEGAKSRDKVFLLLD